MRRSERGSIVLFALAVLLPCVLGGCGEGGGTASNRSGPAERPGQTAGAEQSIEGFGDEAGGSDRRAILVVERSYFAAVASKRYSLACSHLAGSVRRSLAKLVTDSGQNASCPEILPMLLAPQAYAAVRQQMHSEIEKVRKKDARVFVVFHAPGAHLYQLPLVNEGGRWKVRLLTASVLAPSL